MANENQPSLLTRLKETTRPYHERLENRVDLLNRVVSLPAYRTLLGQFWGFYRPLESALLACPEWQQVHFAIEERQKLPRLQSDLEFVDVDAACLKQLPLCEDVPSVDNFGQALGCLYVLEGATLGGQIIARHLHRTLGLDAAHGCAFFNTYGEQVGAQWREFGQFLTEAAARLPDDAEVVEAAVATFIKFEAWLAQQDAT